MMRAVADQMILTKEGEGNSVASSIAMTITLISFSMLFATLFLGYAVFRLTSNVWPPMGMEKISLFYPSLSTGSILISSASLYFVGRKYKALKKVGPSLYFSIFFGVLFVLGQFLLWEHLKLTGVYVDSGIFASVIYGFTWIHAAHMVVGLALLFYLMPLVNDSERKINRLERVQNISKFWHFLGIIWFIMYITLFVI